MLHSSLFVWWFWLLVCLVICVCICGLIWGCLDSVDTSGFRLLWVYAYAIALLF